MDPESEATPDSSNLPIDILLSGGGYRATVFHIGILRFLFEHSWEPNGEAALSNVHRIVGVSGGSIAAAHVAHRFNDYCLHFADSSEDLLKFVTTVDARRAILVKNQPFSDLLSDLLPDQANFSQLVKVPELYILGTNYQSGGVLSFSNKGLRHYRESQEIGKEPRNELVVNNALDMYLRNAVAASAAFPPFLPPVTISADLFSIPPRAEVLSPILGHEIGDGGIRDNLGADFYSAALDGDRVARTCIVSDAGLVFDWTYDPKGEQSFLSWFNRLIRVTDIQMNRLWEGDLQRLRRMELVSLSGWDGAPANEDSKRHAYDQPLTKGTARLAAQRSTDLVPLKEGEVYALIRLGYDVAERSLKSKLGLVPRNPDSMLQNDKDYWKRIFPSDFTRLDEETVRKGTSLHEHLKKTLVNRVADTKDAINHLPVRLSEKSLLCWLVWLKSHPVTSLVSCAVLVTLFFCVSLVSVLWFGGLQNHRLPLANIDPPQQELPLTIGYDSFVTRSEDDYQDGSDSDRARQFVQDNERYDVDWQCIVYASDNNGTYFIRPVKAIPKHQRYDSITLKKGEKLDLLPNKERQVRIKGTIRRVTSDQVSLEKCNVE